jgi:hypothetical protein
MALRDSPPYNASHFNSALARLVQQYKNKPQLKLLMQAILGEFQTVEDMLDDVRWLRAISLATGQQLDNLGKLVGIKRNGLGDETYRTRLRAQVLLNLSSGSPEEIYAIVSAMLALVPGLTLQALEFFPAAFVLRVGNAAITNAADIAAVLQIARDAGVSAVLEYTTDTDANSFIMEPLAAFLSGPTIVGVTSLPVVDTTGFPVSGSIVVDKGLATEETLAYSAKTSTSFTVPATTQAHVANATVQLTTSTGKGYGDTGNGATGGVLAGAI